MTGQLVTLLLCLMLYDIDGLVILMEENDLSESTAYIQRPLVQMPLSCNSNPFCSLAASGSW
jgi:hypothetical protein